MTTEDERVDSTLKRDPADVAAPLKDLPFYATMIDVLIDRCQDLLVAAYDGTMTDEKVDGVTDITNRIVTVSHWLSAAQTLTEEAAAKTPTTPENKPTPARDTKGRAE